MYSRDNRITVLFLGCGSAAAMHSRVLRSLGGIDLVYASRDYRRADLHRRRFNGRRAYGSYDEALSDPEIDLAVITTPTALHRELALSALGASKHVIVEKPAFMCADDCDVVRREALRAGRRVFVAENYFYKPIAEHLREVIGRGDLGDVRFVSINATKCQPATGWRADAGMSGGGALFEAGVHWVSFMNHIGLDVASVRGYRVGLESGSDRSSLVVVRYVNGGVGTLAHSWELRAPLRGLRLSKVQGTEGAVTFESNGFAAFTSGRRRSITLPLFRDVLGYRAMLRDFISSLRTGAVPRFTLEMAAQDLRLLEAASRFDGDCRTDDIPFELTSHR